MPDETPKAKTSHGWENGPRTPLPLAGKRMKANELQVYEILLLLLLLLHPAADSGRKFFWEGKREADGRERVKRVWYTHYVATFNRITTTSLGLPAALGHS